MLKHITIGLFIPYCVLIFLYVKNGFRLKTRVLTAVPYAFLFCVLWSIVPDIILLVPWGIGAAVASNPFFNNIFFFHRSLESMPTLQSIFGLGLMLFILFSVFIIFLRHLEQQEIQIRKLERWR